jgi:sigma-B regulation protein RsbU (phosphoserine phosphatase)
MLHERIRVLLIEHDAGFTRRVGEMLGQARGLSAEVCCAPHLEAGLARLRCEEFHVVILDVCVPDGAGLASINLLKSAAPQMPLIATGDTDNETVAIEAVQAGAQDYLIKSPLTARLLERSIRYALERHRSDLMLLAAEAKYHGIFDHLVEGIFQTTPDGRYLLANTALARIYGYSSPEELTQTLTDIGRKLYVQEGRREEFVQLMQESDVLTDFESEIYRKDGSWIWISENCRAVRGSEGTILYYEGTVEDITQRRKAEEALRNSEALYHSLVEHSPQNIFRKDIQGRFTFANEQYCRHYHCKLEDILGRTDFDFFPPELAEKYHRDDWQVLETGQTLRLTEEHQPKGQEKTYVQVLKSPLYDASGRVIGLQGMFWDITKERQMEEKLRSSEALYHSLVETIPHCIFRKDLAGRYTFVNPEYCRVLEKRPEEILGHTIFDFLPPELAGLRQDDDLSVIQSAKPLMKVEESRFHGSERRFIQVLKLPIFDAQGAAVGLQGMFWDITEQKLAEERIRRANTALAVSREELRAKNLQMEENLRMAREIQVSLLPQQYPVFPAGTTPTDSAFQFSHRYLPAETVSGDFFTISKLSDTEAAVFICDVAGHGVRSALVTAMIRALVEELKPAASDPGQFLSELNRELRAILQHSDTEMPTTAIYLVADCRTGALRFANAGHPKPLLLRRTAGTVSPLANEGGRSQFALGLKENTIYATTEAGFAPGDLLMLFTDGLYEVEDAEQNLFSQAMLVNQVRQRCQMRAGQLFDELLAEVRGFAQEGKFTDDVSLVGLEFHAKPARFNDLLADLRSVARENQLPPG